MKEKIVLIDGHSILNRAFYGVPLLTNASGMHTNAVYGFLNIMFKILDEEKPQYLAVAFDVKEKTFRHEMYEQYKGTRKPMPQELHEQVPLIRELLQAMGVLIMEKPGFEADDILGTMAKKAMQEGMEVSLISGDRDLLQISDTHIKIRIPKTKGGGKTEVENYYPEDVVAKYGVTPLQFIELKALMGDASDNIPGVPKIGEKTATDLITKYKSVAGVYEHLEEITKKSVKQSLEENKDLAELSLKLATIETNAPIPFAPKDALFENLFTQEAYKICQDLELKSLLTRFDSTVIETEQTVELIFLQSKKEQQDVLKRAVQAPYVSFDILPAINRNNEQPVQLSLFEETENTANPGFMICFEANKVYCFEQGDGNPDLAWALHELYEKAPKLVLFDSKKYYPLLFSESDVSGKKVREITSKIFDVLLAAFLLNPLKNDYEVCDVASEYAGLHLPLFKQEFVKKTRESAYEDATELYCSFLGKEVHALFCVAPLLEEKLKLCEMDKLYRDMEQPLSYVLYEMEKTGILVKPNELKAYGDALSDKIIALEKKVIQAAGEEFNLNSPKQLGEILFEKLKLPGAKKTKSGYSTAAEVLENLAPDYPIVADILEYRGLAKLKSTYADGLGAQISDDGRIHTNFHQTITATGRISSTEPNLQNIPVRMEMGRKIRKVFVPKAGCIFMDADYSQIELRILAHMSADAQLIEAYREEEDIHKMTASKVFHVPFDEVTPLQRRNAKAVNFGIVYGISSFGLSQDLSISKKEAAAYIKEYFNTYPGIKEFLDNAVSEAKEKGYSVTMFGRRRPIPELTSSNFMQRGFGERVAMNAPIQGTAADIMKIAMIRVRDELAERKLSSRILLQVHDELLLEVAKEEEDIVAKILREEMEKAVILSVKLDVDLHTGENWYEAK